MYNGEYTKEYRKQLQNSLDKDNALLINKHKQVEDLNYEISLIKNHSVQSLKDFSDPLQAIDFQSIWRDFDHEKHKFTNKESRNTIAFLEENFFFAKDTKRKLLEVVQFQFGESYDFIYEVDGGKIIIAIPKYRLTNEDNYLTIGYKLAWIEDDYMHHVVFHTKFVEEMYNEVQKLLGQLITQNSLNELKGNL